MSIATRVRALEASNRRFIVAMPELFSDDRDRASFQWRVNGQPVGKPSSHERNPNEAIGAFHRRAANEFEAAATNVLPPEAIVISWEDRGL